MKVNLVSNDNGVFVGYTLEAETQEDKQKLNVIRDHYFWGDVDYDGRKDDEHGDVAELAFANREIIKRGTSDSVFNYK